MRGFGGKDFLISAFHWSIFLGFGALRFDSEIMMQAASFTSVLLADKSSLFFYVYFWAKPVRSMRRVENFVRSSN